MAQIWQRSKEKKSRKVISSKLTLVQNERKSYLMADQNINPGEDPSNDNTDDQQPQEPKPAKRKKKRPFGSELKEAREKNRIIRHQQIEEAFNTKIKPLSPSKQRVIDIAGEIYFDEPEEINYQHAIFCQLGLPRSKPYMRDEENKLIYTRDGKKIEAREFERVSGAATLKIHAGDIFIKGKLTSQPLPYGPKPRLALVHISTQAVLTQSRTVDLGSSMRRFMNELGVDTNGKGYRVFKKQMQALAACHMTIGFRDKDGYDNTIYTRPVDEYRAWFSTDQEDQMSFWASEIHLSEKFYNSLLEHPAPLDPRALNGLGHSSLALDIYMWLAHRLRRIQRPGGIKLTWDVLKQQFGMEYPNTKQGRYDFKREFIQALTQVKIAYQEAKIEDTKGGLILKESPPPIKPKPMLLIPPISELKKPDNPKDN